MPKSRFLSSGVAFALTLCLLGAGAAAQEGTASERGLFYPSRLQTPGGALTDPSQFVTAGVCGGCHIDIYYQWSGSMHANAHADPVYLALSRLGSAGSGGLTDRFCAGCHSPIAVASGEVPPVGNPAMSRVGAEGLTCDFCHTVDRSTGIGNLPAVMDPGTRKRGPRKDASSPYHETVYLELATQAEFCGMCHDVSHPLNDLPIERTYSEWKEGPYNSGEEARRVYCQDCHMRQRPGLPSTGQTPRPSWRAKAAAMGPWRENVYTHWFVGANTAVTGLLGAAVQREMAAERLRAAASLEVSALERAGEEARFKVRVTNSGAGHYLPTGLTEVRQMWLEVVVVDRNGHKLLESGALDASGAIGAGAAVFQTVLGDPQGRPTHKVWEADRVLSDRRIPPGATEEVPFAVATGRSKGKLKVRARLLYRSFSPDLAGTLLGDPSLAPAPVQMAVAEAELPE